jgi:integrase
MNNTPCPKKLRFTDAAAERLPLLAAKGQKLIADEAQPGLYLRVGKTGKSWVVQTQVRVLNESMEEVWKTVRRAFGSFPELGAKEARKEAIKRLTAIRDGEGISKSPDGLTLAEAWKLYRDKHMRTRGLSEGTVSEYASHLSNEETGLGDWLDVPLKKLSEEPRRVADRHERISRDGGPYRANGVMRTLRAIYNWTRKKADEKLPPENPTRYVTFNTESRADEAMDAAALGDWLAACREMPNRVRAEMAMFILLSGSRSKAIATARWEHLDLGRRLLHIPTPKGGSAKAFDIPLSRAMIACLARARRAARVYSPQWADTYVFPGLRGPGEDKCKARDRCYLPTSFKALRHTWTTQATTAGVDPLAQKLILNHSVKRDVTAGYVTRESLGNYLHEQQERVSAQILCAA